MLDIRSLTKIYKNGVKAVDDLTLNVGEGEIFCMLGANGAGKTSTINMIFNFIPITEGEILVNGIDVNKNPLRAKKELAYVSENVMLYENFTAIQNLDFFSRLSHNSNNTKDDYLNIFRRVGLPENAFNRRVGAFSKGMRQKCGIAIALVKGANLIVLDEPTSGLDPKSGREFLNLLKELKADKKSIFMTTHDIFRAKEIADKIGIMANGKLLHEIVYEDIHKANIEDIYLSTIKY